MPYRNFEVERGVFMLLFCVWGFHRATTLIQKE